jgi:class 3 adenylate cyclase
MKAKRFLKYGIISLVGVLIAGILSFIYYSADVRGGVSAFLLSFEDRTVNARFRIRYTLRSWMGWKKPESILDRVVIVAIDDKAIAKFGGNFPFDRQVWANYLEYFRALPEGKRPDLIFFDIVFSDASRNPQSDTNLFRAFQSYPGDLAIDFILELSQATVNLGVEDPFFVKIVERDALNYDHPSVKALQRFEVPLQLPYEVVSHYTRQVLVLPDILNSVRYTGAANFFSDNSGVYRYFPSIGSSFYKLGVSNLSVTNVYYPSIQLGLLLHLLGSDKTQILWKNEGIVITNANYKGKREDFFLPFVPRTRGYIAINYLFPPQKGVRVVSLADITKVKLPDHAILLTGMYSKKATHDIWRSPFGEMYGIEHIANALYTLYEKAFIEYPAVWLEIVYIVLLTVIVGLLAARGNVRSTLLGLLVSFFPFLVGIGGMFYNIQVIIFLPFLSGILVLLFAQIYVLITESQEKAFIRQTFSSYLNPKLVDLLIENPGILQLGGSEREITIFFSSIKNFHEVTEGFSAREIVEFLNRYFGFMGDMIIEANGTLDKYMGEMIMAFWGAPLDDPEHAYRACKTAIDMLKKVELFNEEQRRLGLKAVVINIGINTGKAVVGNVGSDKQKNYTAIGDSVNLASRIKGLNKFYHTNIILSEFTYSQVKDRVEVRELDLTRVKGKKEPVRVYELWDVK